MTAEILAAVELAATAIALGTMIALQTLPTGLSWILNPVSQYGISPYRQGYRLLTVAMGVAGLAAAAGVAIGYPPGERSAIVVLLVVFGLCRLTISWWPMDPPGGPRSGHGRVHGALAAGTFLSITIAADLMRHVVQPPRSAASYPGALHAAFWLLVTGLVGMVLARRLDARARYFGAAERLVYAGIYVLLIATGLSLI